LGMTDFNPITQTPFRGEHDESVYKSLSEYLDRHGFTSQEALEYWPLLTRRTTLQRFLALHELFKLTIDVPGDIAEFGVFQGHSLMTWANLLEIYSTTDRSKQVLGFDTFSGFPGFSSQDGLTDNEKERKTLSALRDDSAYLRLKDAIRMYDNDRFVPWKDRVVLVKGDITETLPKFMASNAGRRFSLIYLDLDIYAPTKLVLETVYDKVPAGGIICFDEYAVPAWEGESAAVDEFFANKNERMRTLPWNSSPGAFIIKGSA
jgi:hypothetical protein